MTSRHQLEQSLEEVRTLAAMGRYVGASLDISDVLKTIARYSTALAESDGAVIVDTVSYTHLTLPTIYSV